MDTLFEIATLRKSHCNICELMEKINTLFQPILLPITALLFISIITNVFITALVALKINVFRNFELYKSHFLHILDALIWTVLNIFWFLHMTWMCDATISEVSFVV
jgi:hypothetical protein